MTKGYLGQSLNNLFIDFEEQINNVLYNVSDRIRKYYVAEPKGGNETLYRFGFIPAKGSNTFSPMIFEDLISF